MGAVIPHIYKDRLGRDSHFVLKYSDVESLFLGKTERDVHLRVHSQAPRQVYWKNERDRPRREGLYELLRLSYAPAKSNHDWLVSWIRQQYDEPNPIAVSCHVYALPNQLAMAVNLRRSFVREVARTEVERVAAVGIFDHRWQVTLRLHTQDRVLECVALLWKGVKLASARKQLTEIDQDDSKMVARP